ncbi:hypothetical protein D1093_08690 [Bartonella kosoyi]|uniref:Uncharacterized protein n=1 Tax=Bartonella kosoyi TaxID=2133959 RepID=A0A5B9CYK1_9HYPH|nr:hypothetical protein [Bartonella kosoyi]QEE09216.1 hypothetical protein D1093_06185 [Bartonella kosoyi]QEE09568.1 hypothetical protein D1093_08135 [Bartonella kosoyi]QEE09658.1 hypothetical protein D1093_08690 [Bartonella kosoyi]
MEGPNNGRKAMRGGTHKLMHRTQNVTVHVNGARDPVANGRTVTHTIQRARANALHEGIE